MSAKAFCCFCNSKNEETAWPLLFWNCENNNKSLADIWCCNESAVDSGGAGGARAPPEFGGSEKGRSLISALIGV